MAMTMLELARFRKCDENSLNILNVMDEESDFLKIVPMINNSPGDYQRRWRRANALPSVAFRAKGERFTETGVPGWEEGVDVVAELGTEINVDIADYEASDWTQDPFQYNIDMKQKSMMRLLHDYIINGDLASDEDSFNGIGVRVQELASSQTIYASASGSTELDCTTATLISTPGNAIKLLNKIDSLKEALDGRKADYILCDYQAIKTLKTAYRAAGLSTNYGELVGTPGTISGARETSAVPLSGPHFVDKDGTPWVAAGLKRDNSTKIIANETVNSQTCTPIYAVRFGENYLSGITNHPISVTPFTLLDDQVTMRSTIRMTFGLTMVHPKSIAVLRGVQF